MHSPSIDQETAAKIFDILVQECGAVRDSLCHGFEPFRTYVEKELDRHEYRFGGALGFGGKFYNSGFEWRVSCYSENLTPQRRAMIEQANLRLEALRNEWELARVPAP